MMITDTLQPKENIQAYINNAGLTSMIKADEKNTFHGQIDFTDGGVARFAINTEKRTVEIAFCNLNTKSNRDMLSYFCKLSPKLTKSINTDIYTRFIINIKNKFRNTPYIYVSFYVKKAYFDMKNLFSTMETIIANVKENMPVIDIIIDGEYTLLLPDENMDVIFFDKVKENIRLINQSHQYTVQGKYTEAITVATEAIKLNPHNAYAYNNRGYARSLLLRGYSQEAADDYGDAIKLNPQEKVFYFNAGDIELCAGNYETAKSLFEQALAIDDTYEDARKMLEIAENKLH